MQMSTAVDSGAVIMPYLISCHRRQLRICPNGFLVDDGQDSKRQRSHTADDLPLRRWHAGEVCQRKSFEII